MSEALPRGSSRWLLILTVLLLAICAFFVTTSTNVVVHRLLNDTMQPNYRPGEFMVANRFAYNSSPPARGDVVLYPNPRCLDSYRVDCGDALLEGRVIGVPGDIIERRGGRYYRNKLRITERPLKSEWIVLYETRSNAEISVARESADKGVAYDVGLFYGDNTFYDVAEAHVPAGYVYILADNRDFGHDSVRLGPIAASTIVGKVFIKLPRLGRLPPPPQPIQ